MAHRSGTSLKEHGLFYFLQCIFPDAISGYTVISNDKRLEVDIYIPNLNLAIEYDGKYWHKNKVAADNKKTHELNLLGIKVLRIREFGLPTLKEFDGHTINLPAYNLNETSYDYINLTLQYLASIADGEEKHHIEQMKVTGEIYKAAEKNIYANRFPDIVIPNLSDMCGIEFWHKEKNHPLDITHISKLDWVPAVLVCPNQREIDLPRYHRAYKTDCNKQGSLCQKCVCGEICSLFPFCKKDGNQKISCEYVEKKVWQMINAGQSIENYELKHSFKRWLLSESDIGEKLIKQFNSPLSTAKKKEAIIHFLGFNINHYRRLSAENSFDIYSIF